MGYKTIKNEWLAHRKSLYQSKENNSSSSSGGHEDTHDSQYNKNNNSVNHRKQEMFIRIHELKKHNYSQRAIAKALNINRNTVRYYFEDRKSTRLNSSHVRISYAVFCLKKKKSIVNLSS